MKNTSRSPLELQSFQQNRDNFQDLNDSYQNHNNLPFQILSQEISLNDEDKIIQKHEEKTKQSKTKKIKKPGQRGIQRLHQKAQISQNRPLAQPNTEKSPEQTYRIYFKNIFFLLKKNIKIKINFQNKNKIQNQFKTQVIQSKINSFLKNICLSKKNGVCKKNFGTFIKYWLTIEKLNKIFPSIKEQVISKIIQSLDEKQNQSQEENKKRMRNVIIFQKIFGAIINQFTNSKNFLQDFWGKKQNYGYFKHYQKQLPQFERQINNFILDLHIQ